MGYNSTFSGSLSPSKPIPQELVDRINGMCDLRVLASLSDDAADCGGEVGDVVPDSCNMHGYDIVKDTFRVQRLLSTRGIRLSGEIYRSGEDDDDFEKIEVVNGRVYVRTGEVVYGKRVPVTAKDVTRYAIRVVAPSGRAVGWLGPAGLCGRTYPKVGLKLVGGKPVTDSPPFEAMLLERKDEACKIAAERNKRGRTVYEVIELEDRL